MESVPCPAAIPTDVDLYLNLGHLFFPGNCRETRRASVSLFPQNRDRFIVVTQGDVEQVVPGHALTMQANQPFRGLQQVCGGYPAAALELSVSILPPTGSASSARRPLVS